MPFIDRVLRIVEPFMDRMVITLSEKSTDGTADIVKKFKDDYPEKVILLTENVDNSGELTKERIKQLEYSDSDWILFLDDDDYWTPDQLRLCLAELDKDPNILAYSVNPYQMVDFDSYDANWENRKYFSKFLRRKGLSYVKPWPRDLPIDKNGKPLYHKTHPQVKNLSYKFYHLALMKNYSFRDKEDWAKGYIYKKGKIKKLTNKLII